jgi:hypothetical protein
MQGQPGWAGVKYWPTGQICCGPRYERRAVWAEQLLTGTSSRGAADAGAQLARKAQLAQRRSWRRGAADAKSAAGAGDADASAAEVAAGPGRVAQSNSLKKKGILECLVQHVFLSVFAILLDRFSNLLSCWEQRFGLTLLV